MVMASRRVPCRLGGDACRRNAVPQDRHKYTANAAAIALCSGQEAAGIETTAYFWISYRQILLPEENYDS